MKDRRYTIHICIYIYIHIHIYIYIHVYVYIYIYTWNPNDDHRFCWKFGPCFVGLTKTTQLWFQVYISPTLEIARGPLHNHLLLRGSGFSHNVAMKSTPKDAPSHYTTPKFNSKFSPEKVQRASIGKDGLWGSMLNFRGVYLPLTISSSSSSFHVSFCQSIGQQCLSMKPLSIWVFP